MSPTIRRFIRTFSQSTHLYPLEQSHAYPLEHPHSGPPSPSCLSSQPSSELEPDICDCDYACDYACDYDCDCDCDCEVNGESGCGCCFNDQTNNKHESDDVSENDFIWLIVKAKQRHPLGYAIAYMWLIDPKHHPSSVLIREAIGKLGKRQNQRVRMGLEMGAGMEDSVGVKDESDIAPRSEVTTEVNTSRELEKWLDKQAHVFFSYLEHLMLKEVNFNDQ